MNPSEKAADLHDRATVVVVHDHRPLGPDLPLMRAGGVTAKVYQATLEVDVETGVKASQTREEGWLRLASRDLEEALRSIEAHPEDCFLATSVSDIRRAKQEGRIAILLGAEGAGFLEGAIEPLHLFHRLGLRELQLTWAFPNPLVPEGHLSPFGRQVVSECAQLGIVVDLTHIPPAAFYEVVDVARHPLIISHGSAQGVTTDLDDDQLRALAASKGLLAVHFYITYLGPNPGPEDVVAQIDYVASLVGIDHVALGVDFFPTHGAWRQLQIDQGTTELEWAVPDMSEMGRITACLVAHGYSEEEVRKVMGENFLRVCQEVFGEQP